MRRKFFPPLWGVVLVAKQKGPMRQLLVLTGTAVYLAEELAKGDNSR
jgi:hypothetical protein